MQLLRCWGCMDSFVSDRKLTLTLQCLRQASLLLQLRQHAPSPELILIPDAGSHLRRCTPTPRRLLPECRRATPPARLPGTLAVCTDQRS
jgi:hypothetical protein